MRYCFALIVLAIGSAAFAADTPKGPTADAEGRGEAETYPVLPEPHQHWAGAVVIAILGMFGAAAVIGPVVRANTPEEVPPAHSHDEPPGASHHHGPGGTLAPEPGHGH